MRNIGMVVSSVSLTENALKIIEKRGRSAVDEACRKILKIPAGKGEVSDALNYYATTILPNVLPIFPALIYLSSLAVGGNPEKPKPTAVDMLLVTSAGDIHDDVIDNSINKFGRKTVFGKYGYNTALLAGDVLQIQGMTSLQQDFEPLSLGQRKNIADLISKAMTEIVDAESLETSLWKKKVISPQEYFEVIQLKSAIAELHCKIGGIIGCADTNALEQVARCGRVIGLLSTIKEEFIDLTNSSELEHRIKTELPPYPMLLALQSSELNRQVAKIMSKGRISRKDLEIIVSDVLGSIEVSSLKAELKIMGENELSSNLLLKNKESASELAILVKALSAEL